MDRKNSNRTKLKSFGIFARVSNLIILQVLFIFAAITILVFYPKSYNFLNSNHNSLKQNIDLLKSKIQSQFIDNTKIEEFSFEDISKFETDFTAIAVHEINDEDYSNSNLLKTWIDKDADNYDEKVESLVKYPDFKFRNFVEDKSNERAYSINLDSEWAISYIELDQIEDRKLILVAVSSHELLISPISDIKYMIGLLFLFATLTSLLLIYLIFKRIKTPVDRLITGLDKTARGELYHLIEYEGDREVSKLIESFNQMSRTLFEKNKSLKESYTNLNKTNISLIDSQIFLSTLINSSPINILVTNPDGIILLANDSSCQEFECESENIIGKNINDIVSEAPNHDSNCDQNQSNGREAVCLKSSGDYFPAFIISNPIITDGSNPRAYIFYLTNISESKAFQEMMIRLDRYSTRGEMAGDIAHEINNYLAILLGNVELLPMIIKKKDDEKVDKKLDLMKNTLDRIAQFANGLMDNTQDSLTLEMGSLNQIVENVLAFLKPQNKFDNISIITNLSGKLPNMNFDQAQIQQLLVNLLFNAADALVESEDDPEIKIKTFIEEEYACLVVQDNGPGVVEQKIDSLFKNRFSTKRKGHGIGLITCARIISAHNGKIDYEFDNGAIFRIKLPLNSIHNNSRKQESIESLATG